MAENKKNTTKKMSPEEARHEQAIKMTEESFKNAGRQTKKIVDDLKSGKITRKQAYDRLSKVSVTYYD